MATNSKKRDSNTPLHFLNHKGGIYYEVSGTGTTVQASLVAGPMFIRVQPVDQVNWDVDEKALASAISDKAKEYATVDSCVLGDAWNNRDYGLVYFPVVFTEIINDQKIL